MNKKAAELAQLGFTPLTTEELTNTNGGAARSEAPRRPEKPQHPARKS